MDITLQIGCAEVECAALTAARVHVGRYGITVHPDDPRWAPVYLDRLGPVDVRYRCGEHEGQHEARLKLGMHSTTDEIAMRGKR
jgi:hypothetical protein